MKKSVEEFTKIAKAEYMREYRKRNPEKIRAINEAYWMRRAMRKLAQASGDIQA